eukprot:TRINITY_DN6610_c0_g1_i1.p2 TRINITY_DN6610_c0_g1~~TRINITY_DN6610_c0_g1_i1.p2  ORF type:complete len:54 (-),score=12.75 TRINITY_DN6610_c0_g1_i1:281-442(-)
MKTKIEEEFTVADCDFDEELDQCVGDCSSELCRCVARQNDVVVYVLTLKERYT